MAAWFAHGYKHKHKQNQNQHLLRTCRAVWDKSGKYIFCSSQVSVD